MKTIRRTAKETISPSVRVNVKLASGAARDRGVGILSRLGGVRTFVQTFPHETDQELASLYMLEIDPADLPSALRELRQCPEVEYAEVAPSRKLIRSR